MLSHSEQNQDFMETTTLPNGFKETKTPIFLTDEAPQAQHWHLTWLWQQVKSSMQQTTAPQSHQNNFHIGGGISAEGERENSPGELSEQLKAE